MEDYGDMTQDDFDRILVGLLKKYPIEALLRVGSVYNDLAEEFSNDVLDEWEQAQADKAEENT
jgi:hypothetical protein